jgi:hypothetical protein
LAARNGRFCSPRYSLCLHCSIDLVGHDFRMRSLASLWLAGAIALGLAVAACSALSDDGDTTSSDFSMPRGRGPGSGRRPIGPELDDDGGDAGDAAPAETLAATDDGGDAAPPTDDAGDAAPTDPPADPPADPPPNPAPTTDDAGM